MNNEYKWTHDRHGNPMQVRVPDDNDNEETKAAYQLISELRGLFDSKEEAENYVAIFSIPDRACTLKQEGDAR